eukprot:scpid79877/ scgid19192/ 
MQGHTSASSQFESYFQCQHNYAKTTPAVNGTSSLSLPFPHRMRIFCLDRDRTALSWGRFFAGTRYGLCSSGGSTTLDSELSSPCAASASSLLKSAVGGGGGGGTSTLSSSHGMMAFK